MDRTLMPKVLRGNAYLYLSMIKGMGFHEIAWESGLCDNLINWRILLIIPIVFFSYRNEHGQLDFSSALEFLAIALLLLVIPPCSVVQLAMLITVAKKHDWYYISAQTKEKGQVIPSADNNWRIAPIKSDKKLDVTFETSSSGKAAQFIQAKSAYEVKKVGMNASGFSLYHIDLVN